jgi:hypothetical protein
MTGEINPFCMENIDVSNFLNLHSLGNHEDFCLAYVFTYRDFTGGTLGLAWVASASGTVAVCSFLSMFHFHPPKVLLVEFAKNTRLTQKP